MRAATASIVTLARPCSAAICKAVSSTCGRRRSGPRCSARGRVVLAVRGMPEYRKARPNDRSADGAKNRLGLDDPLLAGRPSLAEHPRVLLVPELQMGLRGVGIAVARLRFARGHGDGIRRRHT